jgi:hypothetical protein
MFRRYVDNFLIIPPEETPSFRGVGAAHEPGIH